MSTVHAPPFHVNHNVGPTPPDGATQLATREAARCRAAGWPYRRAIEHVLAVVTASVLCARPSEQELRMLVLDVFAEAPTVHDEVTGETLEVPL